MATELRLDDLFTAADLESALAGGYVRRVNHPSEPLAILDYTPRAVYGDVWTPVTLTCRGLIYRTDTGVVVARPYPKFFNYGEPRCPPLPLEAAAEVTDKVDGSLGILYPAGGGWAVATRGSFTSEQALHGTQVWRERYSQVQPPAGWTWLFEIVYPGNRIVVDYGPLDDLVALGAVHVETGATHGPAGLTGWPGPAAATFSYGSLGQALAAEPRPGQEGLVVRLGTVRVKIKQPDYVALHRIVTGLSAVTVWQHLVDYGTVERLLEGLPDEFHGWVRQVAAELTVAVEDELVRLEAEYEAVTAAMPTGWVPGRAGRGTFARVAAKHADGWALFMLLDGRDLRPVLWRNCRPAAAETPAAARVEVP